MGELTHLDSQGLPRMVDVSEKAETMREAEAEAVLWVGKEVMRNIRDGRTPKGNIFETARIAGVMGAKRTSDLDSTLSSTNAHVISPWIWSCWTIAS